MRRCLLLLCTACGEPTLYPDEPMPLYGEVEEFTQCSGQVAFTGSGRVEVVNGWSEEVVVSVVDAGCVESPLATIAAGEALDVDGAYGVVFTVRDPLSGFLFLSMKILPDSPARVELP